MQRPLKMDETDLKLIIEALLVSAEEPLSLESLEQAFLDWQKPSREQIMTALDALGSDYKVRAFELKKLASGYCIQTKTQYSTWIGRLQAEKPLKYSRALLETLAIIAYQQPVTRADIEALRGVSLSHSILKTLLEREWVKIAGHRDVPGKPAVYVTTNHFLDYFDLASLQELPPLEEVKHDQ